MKNASYSITLKILTLVALVCGLCSTADAGKTFMFLADWYTSYPSNTDSLMSMDSVYIQNYNPTPNTGYVFDTKPQMLTSMPNSYAESLDVNATAPAGVLVPKKLVRFWYALPNFNSAGYREGKIRINMAYWMAIHRVNTTGTGYVIQRDTAREHGSTSEYNTPTKREMDHCADSLHGDTVWVRNVGPVTNNASNLVCYDHNPFLRNLGTIHLLNPWPGKTAYVQVGARLYPLYAETGRPGWLSTGLWLNPLDPTPFKVRFASGDPSKGGVQYMDAGGLGGNASGVSIDLTAFTGKDAWVIPPTTSTMPTVKAVEPPVKLNLMIHRPNWGASAIRVVWQGSDAKYIATSTEFCDWFSYPMYEGAVPSKIVLFHPLADTLFGSKGLEVAPTSMATFSHWIDLTPVLTMGSTVWAETEGGTKVTFLAAKPASVKSCNEKILAFSSYDFTKSGSQSYYPFSENKDCGIVAAGKETKGLVLDELNAKGRPVWKNVAGRTDANNCNIRNAADGPQNWFDSLVVGGTQLNAFTCVPLKLKLDAGDGYFKYTNTDFFPLDTFKTMKNPAGISVPNPFNEGAAGSGHNYGFCMHSKAGFEYTPGLKFKFTGDDDVWIYINKKLALDLGGTHGPSTGDVNLDKLNLTEGKSYQFDMFFCERQRTGSSINIQTTMNLVPTISVVFDTLNSTPSVQDIITRVTTEQLDPGVCPELGKATVTEKHPGRSTYILILPDGSEVLLDSTVASGYPGLSISTTEGIPNSHIAIDTTLLAKSTKLSQSGLYQIRIELGSDSRIVSFSKVSKIVQLKGVLFDANGDGQPDSVELRTENDVPLAGSKVSATLKWATRDGVADSVTIPGGNIVAQPGDALLTSNLNLPFRTNCPPTGCIGDMGAVLTLVGSETLRNPIVALADGIAPVADSAWLVYDTTGLPGAKDTLYVTVSEPLVKFSGTLSAWNSAFVLAGKTGASRPVKGLGDPTGTTLIKLFLDPAANPLQPGDSVRLGGFSGDALGNSPGLLSKWVYLKADPVAKSWMLDANGDGYPDSIGVEAKGSLASATSATVHWKTASGIDTTFSVPTPNGVSSGIKLPSNILKNATFCDNCYLELVMGGQTKQFVLLDSVAPVALDAKLRYGASKDTLFVTVSESVTQGLATAEGWVAIKGEIAADRSGTLITSNRIGTTDLQLLVAPGSVDKDSVRLRGWVVGNLSKAVGANSPFVKIQYGPQPIRVVVWDKNGDGFVDSILYQLTRSAAGSPNVTGFGLKWGGAILSVPLLAKSSDGLSWSGNISSSSLYTAPVAGDEGWLTVGADQTSFRASVEDSVAPVAINASLVFGLNAGDADTVKITGSEGLGILADGAFAQLGKDSAAGAPTLLTKGNSTPTTTDNTLALVVPSGAIADDIAWVRFGSSVSDNKNLVGVSSRWVKLKLKPSGRAYLFDANGDGMADSVFVFVRGGLASKQAVLHWKTNSGANDKRTWTFPTVVGPFGTRPPEATNWFDRGATFCDNCTIAFLDNQGDPLVEWPLIDSVAPMAISGSYSFGATQDTLRVEFSEALKAVNNINPWLQWGKTSLGGTINHTQVVLSGNSATFYLASSNGAVDGWDSLRLATGAQAGNVTDFGGKGVGLNSPWAPITYGIAPFAAYLLDPDGKGQGTHVRVNLLRLVPAAAVSAIEGFKFSWTNSVGTGLDVRTVSVGDLTWDGTASWTGSIAPFALGQTGCSGGCEAVAASRAGTTRSAALIDSVPSSAIWAKFRYSLPEVGLDTLVIGLSETWTGDDPANLVEALAKVGHSTQSNDVLPMTQWILLAGKELRLVVPPTVGAGLDNTDSVRLANLVRGSRVTDGSDNHVGELSRWVPIVFGLRPPRFDIKPYRSLLKNVKLDGGWEAPPSTYPAVELLVRSSKEGSAFTRVEGSVDQVGPNPINAMEKTLGLELKINRPLEGVLIIYDNMGVSLASIDLTPMKQLWKDQQDKDMTLRVTWNGTGPDHKFVASGVYLFRAVVKYEDKEGNRAFRNQIWKLGFHTDTQR